MYQSVSQSDSMTDLWWGEVGVTSLLQGRGVVYHRSLHRLSATNTQRTLSEGLPQLLGDPLHGLGRDLGAEVAVERRRSTSLSKEST